MAISAPARGVLSELVERHGELSGSIEAIAAAAGAICDSFRSGHRLHICGNGPSHADALHVAGQLVNARAGRRRLSAERHAALLGQPDGEWLAESLQAGLPAFVLGSNGAVVTAIVNELLSADLLFAQELEAVGAGGDVLLALSQNGSARNVVLAAEVARSLGMTVVTIAGDDAEGRQLAEVADVVVDVPERTASEAHAWQAWLCHAICEMIEAEMFPEGRA
ncbi:MAG: SIS domain-containing protein [Acidimicrobiales bacterium]